MGLAFSSSLDVPTPIKAQAVFGTNAYTPATVGALPRGDHARLCGLMKIEYLGLGTKLGALPAVSAGMLIEADPHLGSPAYLGIKRAQGADMSTPAVLENEEVMFS